MFFRQHSTQIESWFSIRLSKLNMLALGYFSLTFDGSKKRGSEQCWLQNAHRHVFPIIGWNAGVVYQEVFTMESVQTRSKTVFHVGGRELIRSLFVTNR